MASKYVRIPISLRRTLADSGRFRAYRPQYFLPSILFGIFVNATASYGPLFSLMIESETLGKPLGSC